MSVIPTRSNQLTSKVIHCNGKNYTITIDDYLPRLESSLNNHMEEVSLDNYTAFHPKDGYPGIKIVRDSGITVLNST